MQRLWFLLTFRCWLIWMAEIAPMLFYYSSCRGLQDGHWFFFKIADEKSEAVCSIFLLYIFPGDTVQEVWHCVGCKSSSRNWEVSSSLSTRFNVRLWAVTAAATLLSASCLQISNLSSFIFVDSCRKIFFCLIGREERVFSPKFLKVLVCLLFYCCHWCRAVLSSFSSHVVIIAITPKLDLNSLKMQKSDQSQTDRLVMKMIFICPWTDAISSRKKQRHWMDLLGFGVFFDKFKSRSFQPSSRWQMGNKHIQCSHSSTVISF